MKNIIYIALGFGFAHILIFSEAFHWSRIREMFYFESFHMYGLLFSAIATAALGIILVKRYNLKNINGAEIKVNKKQVQPIANILGGLFFGMGWGITGACTAPLYILIGLNWKIGLIAITGALLGALLYGILQSKLKH